MPVFYFSNPAGVIDHEADVWAPAGSQALDYELELACVIGREARDLPDDDRALEAVAGFTIMNDWSAATFSASRWPSAWAPARGKTSRPRSGPSSSAFDELADRYRDGRFHLEMTASGQRPLVIAGKLGFDVLDVAAVACPRQPRRHAAPGDVLGSGTVGTGCILELTPEAAGRLAQARRRRRAVDRAAGHLAQPRRRSAPVNG